MDFLDARKKRAHVIRLYIGYVLMGIALIIATLILVFEASGYDVDRKTGAVIQNGLLFVDAHPENASVFLNGVQKGRTDTRLVLPAGSYDLELRRDGYRTWTQKFSLEGSTIERYVYPFLFPEKLDSKEVRLYGSQPGLVTQSPDRKWLLVQQPGAFTTLEMMSLGDENNPVTELRIPGEVLSLGPGTNKLQLVEWSTDNRRVLVKHLYEGGQSFIIIDRETPALSVNLNRTFTFQFDSAKLRDKKFDQLYLHNSKDGSLLAADLRTRLTTPVATGVLAFQPHGDDVVLYATTEGSADGKASVRIRAGLDTFHLRELPASPSYFLDLARYDNEWHIVAGASSEGKAYIYREPFDDLRRAIPRQPVPFIVLKVENPEYLSFSANARFISLQGGAQFSVYDAETERLHRFDTQLPLASGQKASWMDGHRLVLVSEGKLIVFDFNGTNRQTLVPLVAEYLPYFDRDYDFLYALSPSPSMPGRFTLTRTDMRAESD